MTTVAEVADVVRQADRLALACHHHPDGDALGSMLAMHLLCEAHGERSVASWPAPFVVGPHYEFLPGLDRCTPPEQFPTVRVSLRSMGTVDVGEGASRLGGGHGFMAGFVTDGSIPDTVDRVRALITEPPPA